MHRAFPPETRPVFSRGELVGEQRTFDNRLLVTLARRLNPEAWSERSKVEHKGKIDHAHRHQVDVHAVLAQWTEEFPGGPTAAVLGFHGATLLRLLGWLIDGDGRKRSVVDAVFRDEVAPAPRPLRRGERP